MTQTNVKRRRAWHPILTGKLRSRALAAIDEIADALAARRWIGMSDVSLADGKAGLALFFAYADRSFPGRSYDRIAIRLLEDAVKGIAARRMGIGLYSGVSGVAFAVVHAWPRLDAESDDPNEEFDEALRTSVGTSPWRGEYDLIGGLVGIGVYAIERLPRRSARACLARVVNRLVELAERTPEGFAWPSRTKTLSTKHFDLGVAHGTPGVVGLLSAAVAAGERTKRTTGLLDGAVAWLASRRLEGDGRFPYWEIAGKGPSRPARTAWCYGDPGIATALLAAGRALQQRTLVQRAIESAQRAADRPADQSGVVDAGLCHGAAGLGHLFNRIHQSTGDARCGTAARDWFERALDMRRAGGVARFSAVEHASGKPTAVADPGFLTGAAGIGLALLAATTDVEPEWDRLLLASLRTV